MHTRSSQEVRIPEVHIDVCLTLKYDYVLESANWLIFPLQDWFQWRDAVLLVKDLASYFDLILWAEPEQRRFVEAILTLAKVTVQEFTTSSVKIGLTLGSKGHFLIDRINNDE
jgi:hypothetical protein